MGIPSLMRNDRQAFLDAGIKFPNSLVGMFAITIGLIALGEKNAGNIRTFFAPALNWSV